MASRPTALLPCLLLATAAAAAAQAPVAGKGAGASTKTDPVALVAQAEKQLGKKDADVELAVLSLWQALDELALTPASTVRDATALSARFLLQQHDPREGERRKTHASIAKQQVELATAYRLKKWLETATTRVDAADRFDRDAGVKERAAIAAARPKDKPIPAKPANAPAKPAPSLLQKAQAEYLEGTWTETAGSLRVLPAKAGDSNQWISRATHEDNEVSLEFRPTEAGRPHNLALFIGLVLIRSVNYHGGIRFHAEHDGEGRKVGILAWRIDAGAPKLLAEAWKEPTPDADGWLRLAARVQGESVRVFLGEVEYFTIRAEAPVRGQIGMISGLSNEDSCGLEIRNLRIAPLPADAPTDAELKAKAATDDRDAITRLVDEGKALADAKQPEAAAAKLREALARIDAMDAGVLRDALRAGVEPQLDKADPLAPRRRKAAQTIAAELVALADQYAAAGWARAAEQVVAQAAAFDPVGTTARAAAARTSVQQWNIAQATARAAELQPPADDGAVLREWFAKGRKLDTGAGGFAIDGAAARVDVLEPDTLAAWLPHPLAPKTQQAAISVRLAANDASAGLVVDAVDQTNYTIAVLTRRKAGLQLAVYRFAGRAWTTLAHRDVPLDAWRLDGWHRLSVTSNDVGIAARFGDVEVKVARAVIGRATGLVGLFASNSGAQPIACEARAFAVGP